MIYAKVNHDDTSVITYPYTDLMLRNENPGTTFPRDVLTNSDSRQAFSIVEVKEVPQPVSTTHNVSEGTLLYDNGTYTQTWEQTPKTPTELEEQVQATRLDSYGSPQEQLEFISENGLEAWQTKVAEIKAANPKQTL